LNFRYVFITGEPDCAYRVNDVPELVSGWSERAVASAVVAKLVDVNVELGLAVGLGLVVALELELGGGLVEVDGDAEGLAELPEVFVNGKLAGAEAPAVDAVTV
jgi:hypothetical protein